MGNTLVWADIPVADLDRAIRFYSAVLGEPVEKQEYGGFALGLLPGGGSDVTGCLYVATDFEPCPNGVMVYFDCEGRLDVAELAAAEHGGKVLEPRHSIKPHGFRSVVLDSEGNRIALHSM